MRVTIEIEDGSAPASGWMQAAGGPRRPFVGFVELLALLEAARDAVAPGGARDEVG